ncbi:ankyrin repeat-containing domain protein [Nemania sp. NC0429]|nr:ankyrin repeat-containing domain protein [Nemania sp. NC0429]
MALFHLVLAHDLKDTGSSRQAVFNLWHTRFPDALITDFPFLDDAPDNASNLNFLNRAQALLLAIKDKRDSVANRVDQDDHLPCVFICHGLGGSLVKQALVLASLDRKHGRYASDTALLVFCNTPKALEGLEVWRLEVCRLLVVSKPDSHTTTRLFNELPETLERLDWSFGAIQSHYSIINVQSEDEESGNTVWADTTPTLLTRQQSTIYTPADAAGLWSFATGHPVTERIFDIIRGAVKQETQPLSEQFHGFMQQLRRVDSNNYQVVFSQPSTGSMKPLAEQDAFRNWQDLDPDAPNLLYLRTPQGLGSATIASYPIEMLGDSIPNYAIISFSFDKHDLRTQPITTFYVSLIRQLLLSRPFLFHRISAITHWLAVEIGINGREHSYEIYRNIFLSLVKGASPNPIVCVLDAAQDCAGFSLDHIVDLIKEFRRLSKGIFKVMVLSEAPIDGAFVNQPDVCRDINLSTTSWSAVIVGCIESRVEMLAKSAPHWRGCKDAIIKKLCSPSVTYMQASTIIELLNLDDIPSAHNAALEAIEKLRLSEEEVYMATVNHCTRRCQLPLKLLLQWVCHSIRPLSMNELAVVIGLASPNSFSTETLRPNIPLNILNDIRHVNGVLIRTIGLHAHPIHDTIIPVLDEKWHLLGENADSVMLRMCLDYLKMILANIPTISPPPGGKSRDCPEQLTKSLEQQSSEVTLEKEEEEERRCLEFNLTDMTKLEYELLDYAVTSWPEHYKRAPDRDLVKGRVLEIFGKNYEAQAWSALYEKFTNTNTEKFKRLGSLLNIGCRFGLLDIVNDVIGEVKASKQSKYALSVALNLAAGFGHEDIVSLLIKEGAGSNEAPSLAAEYGSLNILQQLIGANPAMATMEDKLGKSPLLRAALSGNGTIASYLIANDAEHTVARGGIMSLHIAAITGQLSLLRKLVDAGSDIHAVAKEKQSSALMLAAEGGFDDVVEFLLSCKARIDDQDSDGETALYRAVKHGHLSTYGLLLNAGANVHTKTAHDLSLIHIASKNGHLEILRALLLKEEDPADTEVKRQVKEGRADGEVQAQEEQVNWQTRYGTDWYNKPEGVLTPLELAVSNGHLNITRELLKHPSYSSEKVRAIALVRAAQYGFPQLVEELLGTGITTIESIDGSNALHLATKEEYPYIVASLLHPASGASGIFDVNAEDSQGWTALHLAADSDRVLTIQMLLDNGANVRHVARENFTALHISSENNRVEITKALLDYVNSHQTSKRDARLIQNVDLETPFIMAVHRGHYKIASDFITNSARLKPRKLEGSKNALIESVSIGKNHLKMVELLLDHTWRVDETNRKGETALHLAAAGGLLDVVKLLLKRGACCNIWDSDKRTPLHQAVINEKEDVVRTLLKAGAHVNAKDREEKTPLWYAALQRSDPVVKILLKRLPELDLNAQDAMGWTPLHACAGSANIIELLLKAGADPMVFDRLGEPTFFTAVKPGSHRTLPVLQVYINAGIDVNTKDKNGKPLIHLIAERSNLESFKLLLESGANIHSISENGETALHFAATNNDTKILEDILKQGANLEADCKTFGTPLMAAARSNRTSAIKLLLQKGANVNAISKSCPTHNPLHTAALEGRSAVLEALIKAGADANIRGGTFGSALCAAVMSGDEDSVKLLLNKDGDINYAEGPHGSALEILLSRFRFAELLGEYMDIANENIPDKSGGEIAQARIKMQAFLGKYSKVRKKPKRPALELALLHQTLTIMELFFERPINVNVVSKGHYGTALIAAIDLSEIKAVERLLDLNANPNLYPAGGESPVQVAIRRGGQSIVEVLVKNGSKLDYQDKCGRGVLSHAISHQSFHLLPYLLQQPSIDINQQDAFGRTPLINVTIKGHIIIDEILKKKPNLNVPDRWGKTALAHAISRDYWILVSKLIEEGADPLIPDIRGRDTLYWAAQASRVTFENVLKYIEASGAPASSFQHAVKAAITKNNADFIRRLFRGRYLPDDHIDHDGWTAAYTALRYGLSSIASLVSDVSPKQDPATLAALPTQWHPTDLSRYLVCQPDNMSVQLAESDAFLQDADDAAIARADHPMIPNKDGIYYFEITVVNGGESTRKRSRGISVGFSDEKAPLDGVLGCENGTWGYYSKNGNLLRGGLDDVPYGPKYNEGSVIGCGVNFKERTAFYTYDGEIIGRAFTNIQGRLYPAVSIDTRMAGYTVTARFWNNEAGANKLFKFQGPYDSPRTQESVEQGDDIDASSISSGEYLSESD